MIESSLLATYLFCSRKVFLEQAFGLSGAERTVRARQSLLERVQAALNESEERVVSRVSLTETLEGIEKLYRSHVSAIAQQAIQEDRQSLLRAGLELAHVHTWVIRKMSSEISHRAANVRSALEKRPADVWQSLSPKIKSRYTVSSESLGLASTIDMLEIYSDRVIPVMVVAGRAPDEGVWPSQQIEAACQIMLLEERFSTQVSRGHVHYLDPGMCREVVLNPFMRERVLSVRDKVRAVLKSKSTPSRVENKNKCKACELEEKCYNDGYMQERLDELNRKV